ncbi:hypothetical protein QD128_004602, partial [Salmonella enterica]|nr:hypothetical protein [Salmonella enterica]EKT2498553.1 hypothetical protein [Salmonella enterica]EKT2659611.1 hypothetical protein [Salmonella enterica]EKT2689601.1 hypothetical protein [Salmonella enterica]
DQIDKNSLFPFKDNFIESKNFDTVFSNCKDKTLQMSVQVSNLGNPLVGDSGSEAFFDSGDPDRVFYYNIQPPKDAEITGGGATLASERVFALDNTRPVLIKPGSDNYTMSSKVNLLYSST